MSKNTSTQFESIQDYLNRPSAYHLVNEIVQVASHRLLEHFNANKEFQTFNNSLNSRADVREMFETLTDKWISDNYLDISTTDPNAMEKYNILTDSNINRVIKDEIFGILWANRT